MLPRGEALYQFLLHVLKTLPEDARYERTFGIDYHGETYRLCFGELAVVIETRAMGAVFRFSAMPRDMEAVARIIALELDLRSQTFPFLDIKHPQLYPDRIDQPLEK